MGMSAHAVNFLTTFLAPQITTGLFWSATTIKITSREHQISLFYYLDYFTYCLGNPGFSILPIRECRFNY